MKVTYNVKWFRYILRYYDNSLDSFYLLNKMKSTVKTSSERNTMNLDDDIHVEKNQHGQDVYVFDPYNPLNTPITKNDIANF